VDDRLLVGADAELDAGERALARELQALPRRFSSATRSRRRSPLTTSPSWM